MNQDGYKRCKKISEKPQSSDKETFNKYRNRHLTKTTMKVVIILTCLVALSRQQQQFPGFGNTFGNLGNAFGNAFNAIFTNSANQLSNSVNRPVASPVNTQGGFGPSVQQRPPVNSFNSPGFFAAVRPIPVARPTGAPVVTPVARPTGAPVLTPVARPTGAPVLTPVARPTGAPVITPVARPTGSAGRRRRTVTAVDTPSPYTAETPKPSTTEAPSSYWPVPGAGWFYG
uniref:Uncharacterized protein n=1 Tax=Daphnia galeata TaxID=27404 RepID=A0A8J2WI82_9CRUS|nr:unnamed protein product [Daphnia galeata]